MICNFTVLYLDLVFVFIILVGSVSEFMSYFSSRKFSDIVLSKIAFLILASGTPVRHLEPSSMSIFLPHFSFLDLSILHLGSSSVLFPRFIIYHFRLSVLLFRETTSWILSFLFFFS